jgi:hypothetical protein
VHRGAPDAHLTVSNQLREQFARTLKADEASLQEDQAMLEEQRPRGG